jgi:hypothetical protein
MAAFKRGREGPRAPALRVEGKGQFRPGEALWLFFHVVSWGEPPVCEIINSRNSPETVIDLKWSVDHQKTSDYRELDASIAVQLA